MASQQEVATAARIREFVGHEGLSYCSRLLVELNCVPDDLADVSIGEFRSYLKTLITPLGSLTVGGSLPGSTTGTPLYTF